ncbi:MAG TPA: class I SAM-dependent methyltransferase [Planctomycetaceae bacterium]|nr:class I SAM-dependent methyltransferase [Planctomycetaceae bacterium]
MGRAAEDILARLPGGNPYAGFPYERYRLDLQGSRPPAVLRPLITELRPRLIVEVGSWKGDSALQMGEIIHEFGLDTAVVCIDTWLGSLEHLTGSVRGWDLRPYLRHGYPTLYYQFLANVMHRRCEDVVVPLANTSDNAARWLIHQQIMADLVYVDGSHEEDDVYRDVCGFWRLLRPGGTMFGDDWHAYWHGVICAVSRFAREQGLPVQVSEQTWSLQKPA